MPRDNTRPRGRQRGQPRSWEPRPIVDCTLTASQVEFICKVVAPCCRENADDAVIQARKWISERANLLMADVARIQHAGYAAAYQRAVYLWITQYMDKIQYGRSKRQQRKEPKPRVRGLIFEDGRGR